MPSERSLSVETTLQFNGRWDYTRPMGMSVLLNSQRELLVRWGVGRCTKTPPRKGIIYLR